MQTSYTILLTIFITHTNGTVSDHNYQLTADEQTAVLAGTQSLTDIASTYAVGVVAIIEAQEVQVARVQSQGVDITAAVAAKAQVNTP